MNTVMIVADYASPYGGNFIPSLLALEKKLVQKNWKCVYVFPKEAKERFWFRTVAESRQVETVDFSQSTWKTIRTFQKLIAQYGAEIIHFHFYVLFVPRIISILNRKCRVFVHLHSDFSQGKTCLKSKIKNLLLYKIFKGRVSYLSVSNAFCKMNPRCIHYLPNALAPDRILSNHTGRDELRKIKRIPDDVTVCEVFGWSPDVKGVDIAVKAVRLLNEEYRDKVVLGIICGERFDEKHMKEYINAKTPCTGNEEYFQYWKPTDDVFSYHAASDILISSSRSEGFSYSILEMLSLGKPCVSSMVPGVEWCRKYDAVSMFAYEDYRGCAEKIHSIIQSKFRISPQTADQIAASYKIDTWTEQVMAFYHL